MKIKILVDAHIFDHSFQGTATYILGLYTSLVKDEKFEIYLCAYDIKKLKSLFTNPNFNFIKLQSKSKFNRLFFEIPKIIKSGKFDFAHFQYIVPFFKSCRFINTIHDILFLDFREYFPLSYRIKNFLLFKISALRSDLILTVSEYSKRQLAQNFSLPLEKIIVTPNAVTNSKVKNTESKNDFSLSKYILYVSRFEPRKNHIGLLNSFIRLKLYEQGYQLVFVGSKKESIEQEAYNALIDAIPKEIENSIIFLEGVSFNQLDHLYNNAECFVFPSLAEGFGIPPIEAALKGCKVLCSNLTAMQEFSFFKYLYDPHNSVMADLLLKEILLDDNYPHIEIIQAILHRYNWDQIAQDYSQHLKKNRSK